VSEGRGSIGCGWSRRHRRQRGARRRAVVARGSTRRSAQRHRCARCSRCGARFLPRPFPWPGRGRRATHEGDTLLCSVGGGVGGGTPRRAVAGQWGEWLRWGGGSARSCGARWPRKHWLPSKHPPRRHRDGRNGRGARRRPPAVGRFRRPQRTTGRPAPRHSGATLPTAVTVAVTAVAVADRTRVRATTGQPAASGASAILARAPAPPAPSA